ncbi:MAG: GYF domain-containing protein [Terrimicrobiaceae bacterium]
MSWYYASKDKTQMGPVDDATLEGLLRSGEISAETLVWKQGMAGWLPYATATGQSIAPGTIATQCAECGQTFPPEQLITLAGRSICAACKPVAVQKFQEGVVGFGQTADPEELWRQVQQRGINFTVGSILSRSWKLVTGNFWPCVGVTLLCYLILMGSGQIPILGLVAAFLVQPQIIAGLYWYFLKQFRGQEATLNDSFEGFRRGFGQQALYMLIVFGVILACILPLALGAALAIPLMKGDNSQWGIIVLGVIGLVFALAIAYYTLSWVFAPILILDKGLKATAAMKLSRRVIGLRFWKIVGLFFVIGLLCFASLLVFVVGIVVMLPVAFAMISLLYEDIFGRNGAQAAS